MHAWLPGPNSPPPRRRSPPAIRALLHQYGPGLGYLATIRPDGGPRVHPVSPVVTDDGLFCFVVDSPKRRDLERDGRYALHAFPPEDTDDEAYLTGRALPVTDPPPSPDWPTPCAPRRRSTGGSSSSTVETAMLRRHGPAGALPAGRAPPRSRSRIAGVPREATRKLAMAG